MTIKLKDIIPAPWNPRGEITEASVATLAQTMKENGLSTPITLGTIKATGKTYLIAGHRRVVAAKSLGWKEIPFSLVEYATEEDATLATINDNDQRLEADLIGSARSISALLDLGYDAEKIARKMSRSTAWVNRRRKLIALDEAFKAAADRFTAHELETIAAYPADVQKRAAKTYAPETAKFEWIKSVLNRECRSLDDTAFDVTECRGCTARTGAEADLFGVCDGALGSCMNRKCFEAKLKAFEDALVAKKTKGATEIVRHECSWQMPHGEKKRSKACPCAHVYVGADGKVDVLWTESEAAKKEREAAEAAKRAEKDRAAKEKRDRLNAIVDKLDELTQADEGSAAALALDGYLYEVIDGKKSDALREHLKMLLFDDLDNYNGDGAWGKLVTMMPKIATLANLTDDETATIVAEYHGDED